MAGVWKKVVFWLTRLIQAAFFIVAAVLEYLADKKMGVNRYLVYKNAYYEEIMAYSLSVQYVLLMLFVITLVGVLFCFFKRKESTITRNLLGLASIILIMVIFIAFKDFFSLKAYYIFLEALLASLVLELVRFLMKIISFQLR